MKRKPAAPIIAACLLLMFGICFVFFVKKINIVTPHESTASKVVVRVDHSANPVATEPYENILPNQSEKINQWALSNDGTFSQFYNDYECWYPDEMKAVAGVDIGWKEPEGQKRHVTIAVLDTEIDTSHYAIRQDRLWRNPDETAEDIHGWNFRDNNSLSYKAEINHGIHGTHTVGILIGEDKAIGYRGLLSNMDVSIMCLKVLDGVENKGRIADVVRAIQYAEANGAKICLLSLRTFKKDESLKEVMGNSSMLFVVAAGNDGMDIDKTPVYPASFKLPNMITVADLRCDGQLSKTSNYGKDTVDIAAPGTDIISTIPGGGYRYLSGTSCAVPFVAGHAAVAYCSAAKEMTASEIKAQVLASADH